MQELFLFGIVVLIMSVVVHEVTHGYVAEILGDPTARLAGRLTLNPLKHLDPFGSVILPALLVIANSPVLFGWARPVPYNPYNLRNGKWGPGVVALSGPLANIFLALFFGILMRVGVVEGGVTEIVALIVFINLILAIFNLIPIPPLDGSKVVASFLPYRYYRHWARLEGLVTQYGLIFLFVFLIIFWSIILPVVFRIVSFLFLVVTGESALLYLQ